MTQSCKKGCKKFDTNLLTFAGLNVSKNRTGYHSHINSKEVTELIRELALVCEDSAIVSILNGLGYRTGNGNTWTEKRVQNVRNTKGFSVCPQPEQRLWITMQQTAETPNISSMVVRRLIAEKVLPAKHLGTAKIAASRTILLCGLGCGSESRGPHPALFR